jgi:hypothetical protein
MALNKVYVSSSKFGLEAVVRFYLLLADGTLDLSAVPILLHDAVVRVVGDEVAAGQ